MTQKIIESKNNLLNLEEKRKFLLEELEGSYKKSVNFEKFLGPGIKKKIQRMLFCSDIYLPYLFLKLNLFPSIKNKKINLLNYKEITLDVNDSDSFFLFKFRFLSSTSEYKLTKFFIKNIKETDVFYDIGANYGFYTYLALELCQGVHSFEPIPCIFENLKENLKNTHNVFLNNLAISDKNGLTFLYIPSRASGSSTIIKEVDKKLKRKSNKIEVQTITLDDYVEKHSKPTIIKLDVEGAESQVIDGGTETLKQSNPIIAIEIWKKALGNDSHLKAIDILYSLGYKSYKINNEGELEFIEKIDPERDVLEKDTYDNFIFKK